MPKYTPRSVLADIEMDEEFMEVFEKYNEKEMDPVEMDLKIQADRVIYVINLCMAKLNLMAHLPHLLEKDGEILRKFLKKGECAFVTHLLMGWGVKFDWKVADITKTAEEYAKINHPSYPSAMFSKVSSPFAIPIKDIYDEIPDAQIFQMIDILFRNKCIQSYIRMVREPKVVRSLMNLIRIMQDLKAVAKSKLYTSGDKEDAMKRELRRAYKSNDLLTVVIDDLKEQLEKQRKELGDQLNEKVKIFEMYHKKMETIKENYQVQIKKTLHKSEKLMMHKSIQSEAKQADLADAARRVVNQYESMLAEHLEQEKHSRLRRFKTETQLQNWLTKYDQDIGEKQTEYEALKKEYDEKKAEMDEYEKLIDEQEEEYNTLMEEKRQEEERIFREMAYHFLVNRSARKIQRYWRAYRERKAKRKGRKGRGKGRKTKVKGPKKPPVLRTTDISELLGKDKKIKDHVFEDLQNTDSDAFSKKQ
ncbi:hypothetical protein JTB14_035332 [Gonioctena quinquepunctata]|nr:hypothetical protein JTB14_035332 [Gonioctena quinquepunctata]